MREYQTTLHLYTREHRRHSHQAFITAQTCTTPRDSQSRTCLKGCVVIKYNKLSLIKKKHKNKRELKTKTRNNPLMTHTRTQTNTYEHRSRQPIRRGVPIGDDRRAPGRRRYNKEESQRRNHIHAQTQDHTEQTAERCHCGTTTNRHMIYPDTSNRIHPVQGGFHPSLHSVLIFFLSSPRIVDRGSYT